MISEVMGTVQVVVFSFDGFFMYRMKWEKYEDSSKIVGIILSVGPYFGFHCFLLSHFKFFLSLLLSLFFKVHPRRTNSVALSSILLAI